MRDILIEIVDLNTLLIFLQAVIKRIVHVLVNEQTGFRCELVELVVRIDALIILRPQPDDVAYGIELYRFLHKMRRVDPGFAR
jgi:hypothetical protein